MGHRYWPLIPVPSALPTPAPASVPARSHRRVYSTSVRTGQNNPGAQYPFGALRLGPDTSRDDLNPDFTNFGGYLYPYARAGAHTQPGRLGT